MSQENWTREQKILLVTLIFVALTCVAAYIIVPEVRHWVGLDGFDADSSSNKNKETGVGRTSTNSGNVNRIESANRNPTPIVPLSSQVQPISGEPRKLGGIGFQEDPYVDLRFGNAALSLLDMASYSSGNVYIRLRLCNYGNQSDEIKQIFLWYTTRDHPAIAWTLPANLKTFASLKPGECREIGAWSETTSKVVQFTNPLGVLHISQTPDNNEESIDLNEVAAKGKVVF